MRKILVMLRDQVIWEYPIAEVQRPPALTWIWNLFGHFRDISVECKTHFRGAMTSQQRKHRCPFPHNFSNRFAVSFLAPSPSPRPLLHLMGVKDEELQDHLVRQHPYALRSSEQVRAHNLKGSSKKTFFLGIIPKPAHPPPPQALLGMNFGQI